MGEEKISPRDAGELAGCFAVHADGLFGYACVLTRGDRALADDLVQAAFEAAARAWGVLRCLAEEQRRSWLRATAANIAVSGFRREAALRDRLPRIEERYRKAQVDISVLALSSIVLERCWQIIKDMPERQHAVAVLRWQQGMKQAEIAAALGIAEKTVSVHLNRARLAADRPTGTGLPLYQRQRRRAIVMTTGRRWAADSREDERLSGLYQQLTELQATRFAAGYDIAAGLHRYWTWLDEHAAEEHSGPGAIPAAGLTVLRAGLGETSAGTAAPGIRQAAAAAEATRASADVCSRTPAAAAAGTPPKR